MAYNFSYKSVGGATRVRIQSGADIAHLAELDQKKWTVLSCPVKGLEIDERSLALIDADGDGQLHVSEVVRTAQWLDSMLTDMDLLLLGKASLPCTALRDEALRALAETIAEGKPEITLAEVQAAKAAVTVAAQPVELEAEVAPYEADVMAAFHLKKDEIAHYYAQLKLQKLGLATLEADVVAPQLSEAELAEMGAKIAAYEALVAANAAKKEAAVQADAAALAAAQAQYLPLEKLLMLSRDFYRLLRNFLTLEDFYDNNDETVASFQAGTLVIDQRSCKLCMRVNDMAKHDQQAALSGMFLIYCDCVNRVLGQTMRIVAAVTVGEIRQLTVGKNAIFYDQQGRDWDATIVKVIDNPISVGQAFLSPYRKFGNWVVELVNKSAAEKESKSFEDMKTKASDTTATAAANAEAKKNGEAVQPQSFDIAKFAGIFAAIGMALGFIGSFLTSLAGGVKSLAVPHVWPLAVAIVGLLLCISGPSMFIAWLKLRRRNIAPLLNANGWAVNADSLVSVRFGETLTEKVSFPKISIPKK